MFSITDKSRNIVLLLAVLLFSAFSLKTASAATTTIDPYRLEAIATVNGIKITRLALDATVAKLLPYASLHKSVSERRYEQTRKESLDQLINVELLYKYAVDTNKGKAPKKVIDDRIAVLKTRAPKGQTLESILKSSNMTMKDLRKELNKTYVIRMLKDAKKEEHEKQADKKVDMAFMEEYYKANLHKFKEPARNKLSGILLKSDPSGGPKGWKKTEKRALEILAEARGGADFAELAKKHSEGPNAANGGDMGWAHAGSLLEQIDHAASTLKKGEYSEPVMSIYGYHIIKLIDTTPSVQKKFKDLNHKRLKEQLVKKEYKLNHEAWIEELRKDADIVILVKGLY